MVKFHWGGFATNRQSCLVCVLIECLSFFSSSLNIQKVPTNYLRASLQHTGLDVVQTYQNLRPCTLHTESKSWTLAQNQGTCILFLFWLMLLLCQRSYIFNAYSKFIDLKVLVFSNLVLKNFCKHILQTKMLYLYTVKTFL